MKIIKSLASPQGRKMNIKKIIGGVAAAAGLYLGYQVAKKAFYKVQQPALKFKEAVETAGPSLKNPPKTPLSNLWFDKLEKNMKNLVDLSNQEIGFV